MTQEFQWLAGLDDRSLDNEIWVERMLAGVVSYNEKFNTSLVPKATIEAYLKWDAVMRSKESARRLWETLQDKS